MIKVKCETCGKEFYCNGDKDCKSMVEYARLRNKPVVCYCASCTIKGRLEGTLSLAESLRECGYRTVSEFEANAPEQVKFT